MLLRPANVRDRYDDPLVIPIASPLVRDEQSVCSWSMDTDSERLCLFDDLIWKSHNVQSNPLILKDRGSVPDH